MVHQDVMEIVMPEMIVVEVTVMTTVEAEVIVAMIVTAVMVVTVMTTLLVELIAMPVKTVTAAAEVMTVVEVVMVVVGMITVIVPLAMLHQPPMVTQLLAARAESHTMVEATMMRDSPVANLDC